MLDPQAARLLAIYAEGPSVTDPGFGPADIDRIRREARAAALEEPRLPVDRVEDVDAHGVPARLYVPTGARGVVVHVHGGGFVFGDLETHDAVSRRIAVRTGLAVLAVDYRRPPEHRFPAAVHDVDRAVGWLRGDGASAGVPHERLVVLGDSAGGNLALVGALRHPGVFAAAVLVYPFLDPALREATYGTEENAGLTRAEAAWYWDQYAARPEDLRDPDLAPLESTGLGALPPTLVQAAEHDVLRGEDLELARRLGAAGGTVQVTTYPGMVHGFWNNVAVVDAADEALAEIADFLRRHV